MKCTLVLLIKIMLNSAIYIMVSSTITSNGRDDENHACRNNSFD